MRRRFRAVVDVDGKREPLGGQGGRVDADPARQDRRPTDAVRGGLDRCGQAHADGRNGVAAAPEFDESVVEKRSGSFYSVLGAVPGRQLDPFLGEDLVRQVGDGDGEMPVPEVDPDGQARRPGELHGPSPLARTLGGGHLHQTAGCQFPDQIRHRGRARPVRRAISACVSSPPDCRTRTTRC